MVLDRKMETNKQNWKRNEQFKEEIFNGRHKRTMESINELIKNWHQIKKRKRKRKKNMAVWKQKKKNSFSK